MTERLVHTAAVPVAIAPRGYPLSPVPMGRLTAAYGGAADAAGLIQTAAELAQQWSVRLRIASFTVRPATVFGGSIERSAEDLVVRRWTRKTLDAALRQLNEARAKIPIPDVDLVIGTGTDWREAVNNIAWQSGDMLLLGSGAAGSMAQVFLGSAASKILRHAPVPVMIVPQASHAERVTITSLGKPAQPLIGRDGDLWFGPGGLWHQTHLCCYRPRRPVAVPDLDPLTLLRLMGVFSIR